MGYIYVSSSGRMGRHEGRIDIFSPRGVFVTETHLPRKISERPCRIAVDGSGRIYIAARPMAVPSEGNIDVKAHPHATAFRYAILRYTPDRYPPRPDAKYGLPVILVLWGEDYGVAVDSKDGDVYVAAEAAREYSYKGDLLNAANEIQRIAVEGRRGSFALAFGGSGTKPIRYGAPPSMVEHALEGLPVIGTGNVSVGRGAGGSRNSYTVAFIGALADQELGKVECDGDGLLGGEGGCSIRVVRKGRSGAIGFGARDVDVWERNGDVFLSARGPGGGERFAEEKWVVNVYDGKDHRLIDTIPNVSGEPQPPYPSIAIDQGNGDVYVEDFKRHRVEQFRKDRKSGKYELLSTIGHGEYLKRPPAGADLAVDGSPESPNHGYLFVTSEDRSGGHVYAFAPAASPTRASTKGR
jgi:hypothetical protein